MITQKISPEVFASAALMASVMRARSACEIMGSSPHQLPDEPPPPNEPPPPENPPPSKPPPHPPDEPEDHDEPDGPIHESPRERRPRSRGMAPTSVRNTSPNTKMTSSTTSNEPQFTAASGRLAARCCHSAASPVSTLTMSSTPRLMPPGKSLARKRGMIDRKSTRLNSSH